MSAAFEVYRAGPADHVLLSCEHASNALPPPWSWPEEDAWIRELHWAWDPGAADTCRELADALKTTAVLSCFSRLLADPNRPPDSPELFRPRADGRVIALNQNLDHGEKLRRIVETYERYHSALDRETQHSRAHLLFSVHTFNPEYEGKVREMELGILYDQEEQLGQQLCTHLCQLGHRAVENEPWSGKGGLIYSIERPALEHGRHALEIEVRNDLATDPTYRARLVPQLAEWLLAAAQALTPS